MSSVNFKTVKRFTKILLTPLFLSGFLVSSAYGWDVDFSRRQSDLDRLAKRNRSPASVETSASVFNLEEMIMPVLPTQDIVILNTSKGFIPERVHVRKGDSYRIHVVNMNPEKRNISFILDEFAESHSTPYAKEKSFELRPKKAGEYSFHCPETSFRGRFIVIEGDRKPASK